MLLAHNEEVLVVLAEAGSRSEAAAWGRPTGGQSKPRRRVKGAGFRDQRTLDTFDRKFNALDRALIFDLANGRFIEQCEDVLMLGNVGVGKSHLAEAIGMAAIHAGFRVLYR
jgi:DNA replication protein DnaC